MIAAKHKRRIYTLKEMKPELLEMKSGPGEKATEWKTKCEKVNGRSIA